MEEAEIVAETDTLAVPPCFAAAGALDHVIVTAQRFNRSADSVTRSHSSFGSNQYSAKLEIDFCFINNYCSDLIKKI